MSIYKTGLFVLGASILMACAAPSTQQPENKVEKAYTPKPGAAVEFSSEVPKSMVAGQYQTVKLKFAESYPENALSISLTTSKGLSLFGGMDRKSFDMGAGREHVWDIDVSAAEDGIYFLNVFVEADGQPRAFSVKLEIGDVTPAMRNRAVKSTGEVVNGVRVMEAEEAIR
ncbi:hypothetical protein [Litorimonas sp. WD9-15]|uniref:hypothetical protein n=1 Tax=Litorimonas sp. WD9-15 TaxID=3418716 RepID=UPI003D01B957